MENWQAVMNLGSRKENVKADREEKLEKQENPRGRVIVYDWLRLIATIYVVIGHSAYLSVQSVWGGGII